MGNRYKVGEVVIIFAVSSAYLGYLVEEHKGYEFDLQAYSSLAQANDGLLKTNASDIYGFALVLRSLPEDPKGVSNFIKRCDMVSEGSLCRKRFVIAAEDTTGIMDLVRKGKFKNLDIYLVPIDILTDQVIKRDIYGTILSGYLKPYAPVPASVFDLKKFKAKGSLACKPVFSTVDLRIVDTVRVRPTLKETEIEDMALEVLRDVGGVPYRMRKFVISKAVEGNDRDTELEEFIDGLADAKSRIHYRMLYEYVRRENLVEVDKRFFK